MYAKLRHIKAVVTEVNFSTSSVKLAFNAIEYITKKPKCGFSEGKYIKKIKTRLSKQNIFSFIYHMLLIYFTNSS